MKRINRARCDACGDVITSEYRHDFKWCECGRLAIDGGSAYRKRSFVDLPGPGYTDLSEGFGPGE